MPNAKKLLSEVYLEIDFWKCPVSDVLFDFTQTNITLRLGFIQRLQGSKKTKGDTLFLLCFHCLLASLHETFQTAAW